MKSRVFVVQMFKDGHRDSDSYVEGVYSTLERAVEAGHKAKDRGDGRYEHEINSFIQDSGRVLMMRHGKGPVSNLQKAGNERVAKVGERIFDVDRVRGIVANLHSIFGNSENAKK